LYEGALSFSLFFGMMLGAVGWGACSDLMGRLAAFNATLFFTAIFGVAAGFAPNFFWLCVSLFLLGSAVGVSANVELNNIREQAHLYVAPGLYANRWNAAPRTHAKWEAVLVDCLICLFQFRISFVSHRWDM
jgi:MFS family permease